MTGEKLMWESPAEPRETGRDAAGRFVREAFGVDRETAWCGGPGEFHFPDGAWVYRVELAGPLWRVYRTADQSPRGKLYSEARRKSRRRPEGGEG